jgi:hypothetical protein
MEILGLDTNKRRILMAEMRFLEGGQNKEWKDVIQIGIHIFFKCVLCNFTY